MALQLANPGVERLGACIPHAYDTTPAYSIGVEEEFLLVDPEEGTPHASAGRLLELGADDPHDPLRHEVVQSVVEAVTPVCGSIAEIGEVLRRNRRILAERGSLVGCAPVSTGAHPFCADPQPLTPGKRYLRIAREYPWVLDEAATCGLHVHVGVQGADLAIQTCNVLRNFLPHLVALSANSPVWRGATTGLHSTRVLLAQLYPRSGVPPEFADYEDYCRTIRALEVGTGVDDYTHTWWFVRPHPRFGTIEVRICDAQTDVRRSVALAALVRCLVEWIHDEELGSASTAPPQVVIEENIWAAARGGMRSEFIDHDLGHRVSAHREVCELLHALDPYFHRLGARECLATLRQMADGDGASLQLAELGAAGGDTRALVGRLAAMTTDGCAS